MTVSFVAIAKRRRPVGDARVVYPMVQRKFSIGIDLGTSNSVLAYAPLSGAGRAEALAIPQWDTPATEIDAETLPSFLYRPEDAIAAELRGAGLVLDGWVVGRLARRKASETPGRVAHSAKSWLCHHAADRSARFLPWASDELTPQEKISPVSASALILAHLRAAWNLRFAGRGPEYAFDAQDITITVPASFDAAAQRLTLAAAQEARFPDHVRLLEEPQAAFYWWLDQQSGGDGWSFLGVSPDGSRHVLVIDVGGGTSDFSLFEVSKPESDRDPEIKRIAVSDHILLGGDNIDLAIAHLLEPRFTAGEGLVPTSDGSLSARQWDYLIAQCRVLKEKALTEDDAPDKAFTASIPGRGASLLAGAVSAQVMRAELKRLLLEGFFPNCWSTDKPRRALGAIKEWGLPYAYDGAITRHLAAFLHGRPDVDAVLFNGGSLKPAQVRQRLREQIGKWQEGQTPQELHSAELDLAVARGAALAGRRLRGGAGRIEAGAAHAVFFEAHRCRGDARADAAERSLVCILPHGAPPETTYEVSNLDLHLRINRPVRFQIYTSTRQEDKNAGDVVALTPDDFDALPPLETVVTLERSSTADAASTVPVALNARLNELSLLQVSCRSLAPRIQQVWPLEFNLRADERDSAGPAGAAAPQQFEVAPDSLSNARQFIAAFARPLKKGEKITAQRLFDKLEQLLGRPKGKWNGTLLRELWTALATSEAGRALSVEHEEAWLILTGFLLRPGFGVVMDERRIDDLWRIVRDGPRFPGKRIKLQEYILWRRVGGGLDRERQEALLAAERDRLRQNKAAPPELIRMAGSFERIGKELKAELIEQFIETTLQLACQQKHVAPYLAALGMLLNRTPFHAGPETIVSPDLVGTAYDALRQFDWSSAQFEEAQALFMRAARAVEDPRLNPSRSLREKIANKLEKCGVSSLKTGRLRDVVPVEQTERLNLFGEALPPGLILGGDQ